MTPVVYGQITQVTPWWKYMHCSDLWPWRECALQMCLERRSPGSRCFCPLLCSWLFLGAEKFRGGSHDLPKFCVKCHVMYQNLMFEKHSLRDLDSIFELQGLPQKTCLCGTGSLLSGNIVFLCFSSCFDYNTWLTCNISRLLNKLILHCRQWVNWWQHWTSRRSSRWEQVKSLSSVGCFSSSIALQIYIL